jgi:hypothetical protein
MTAVSRQWLDILAWRRLLAARTPDAPAPAPGYGWRGEGNIWRNLVITRFIHAAGVDYPLGEGKVTVNPLSRSVTVAHHGFEITMPLDAIRYHRQSVVKQLRAMGFMIEGKAY